MDRSEKLRQLEAKRQPQKIALITGDEFSDVLEDKIKTLKEVLGKGIDLNDSEELIEQLNVLQSFHGEVKALKQAISEIHFPDSISVQGLEALTEATKALDKTDRIETAIGGLKDKFEAIHKAATDDIYARYAWANSGTGRGGQYVGYVAQNGNWFIQRIGTDAQNNKSSTFAAGLNDYSGNWAVKEQLAYAARDKVRIP